MLDLINAFISNVLDYKFWNNDVKSYVISLAIFVSILIVLQVFKRVIVKKIKKLAKKTKTKFDDHVIDVIGNIGGPFYFFIALFFAIKTLTISDFVAQIMKYGTLIIITFYVTRAIVQVIDVAKKAIITKKQEAESDTSVVSLMGGLAKAIVWMIAFLFVLQNSGYNVTGLMAGLGIGGIAIAFALQNILEDIFSSVSIYFDKPFESGDFIIIGSDMGVVKKIGIKTTRIQTLQGQELVVSNKELTQTRVNNYKKMEKRRISFKFGVTYETPVKKVEKIQKIVTDIVNSVKDVECNRVHFKEFGDFSLNFEIVYYLDNSDYNVYMDSQQEMNIKIMKAFEKEKISMAYPTQTLYINK